MKIIPAVLLIAVGSLLFGGGCGQNTPKMMPVRGKLTFEGGAWPKPGKMIFSPLKSEPGFPCKPGIATFNTDGEFSAKTDDYEGLIPGEYRIAVMCWKIAPISTRPGVGYIDDKFTGFGSSGLTLKVDPNQSGPVIWNCDFPRKKEKAQK
jgi:hypothetical protein